ncbi:hypothetical protein [Streptomyces sp. MMG1121]|uniref:hypothetical protein n=1 Tax=Streptomyces sp. MMG1121 TaxID=1415544 RepID=UPI0006AE8C4C|nr:hypothetical protein [Streptomyces sp. MMG1121]KOV60509.1 hypothetical protein ADK64_30530 [Streptomyces sp. MMG1121]
MNSFLLRLYPADFRRVFGDEIAESYREATEGAGRTARLREASDVVAHALRLRLGVGSAYPGGRLFAAVAPFALAATAAYAAFNLISTLGDMYAIGDPAFLAPLVYTMNGCYLLALLGAVVALGGRFVPGALCALAGMVGASVCFVAPLGLWSDLPQPFAFASFLLAPVLVAALPLACPPDLRPARRVRSAAGIVALVIWALLLLAAVVVIDPSGLGLVFCWRYGVPMLAALALAGRPAFARIRTAGRFTCAAVPFLVTGYYAGVVHNEELLPLLGALAVTAVTLRLRRGGDSGTANSV